MPAHSADVSLPLQADNRPIGIIGAMPEEIAGLIARLSPLQAGAVGGATGNTAPASTTIVVGTRHFHCGRVDGVDCVAVLSRIGKVAAAATSSILIHRFGVRAILFVGVAGGIAGAVRVGDIVVGTQFIQHDMDASPLFPRFEIPLLGKTRFDADAVWSARLMDAAHHYLATHAATHDGAEATRQPQVHAGLIGSGDRFVSSAEERSRLTDAMPDLLAVDMESAAVAQVCEEQRIPFAAMRSISDSADEGAAMDFPVFLYEVAAVYAEGVLTEVFAQLRPNQAPDASATVTAG
jgi:adenosylhomocysteine nucleosidase